MYRWIYLLLLAFTAQLHPHHAEAGVIVTAEALDGLGVEAPAEHGMSDYRQHSQDERDCVVELGHASDLSGSAEVTRGNSRVVSLPVELVAMHPVGGLCWRVSIANSTLPGPPVLTGLLKPS